MYLIVERVAPSVRAWAPVELTADNPSDAYNEAEKRFLSWKPESITACLLYHMDRDGKFTLIWDFVKGGNRP